MRKEEIAPATETRIQESGSWHTSGKISNSSLLCLVRNIALADGDNVNALHLPYAELLVQYWYYSSILMPESTIDVHFFHDNDIII